jgi:hypothetical protein
MLIILANIHAKSNGSIESEPNWKDWSRSRKRGQG